MYIYIYVYIYIYLLDVPYVQADLQGKFDEALGNAETAIAALGSSAAGRAGAELRPTRNVALTIEMEHTHKHMYIYIYIYMYILYKVMQSAQQ